MVEELKARVAKIIDAWAMDSQGRDILTRHSRENALAKAGEIIDLLSSPPDETVKALRAEVERLTVHGAAFAAADGDRIHALEGDYSALKLTSESVEKALKADAEYYRKEYNGEVQRRFDAEVRAEQAEARIVEADRLLKTAITETFGPLVGGGDGNTRIVNPLTATTHNAIVAHLRASTILNQSGEDQ